MSRAWVVAGVAAGFLVAGVMLGMQAALGAALQGRPEPLGPTILGALVQTVPWIPVTLAVIGMAVRFPLSEGRWRRALLVHGVAVPAVAFLANVGVVAGFWATQGTWQGWRTLAGAAATWAVLRLHVAAFLYAAIAGLTWVWLHRRDLRARELHLARLEGSLATARLQALTAQIRPHFLFNTLHTIGQLWRSGRSDEADAMLDRLGALFQTVQRTTDRTDIALEEELTMVEDYLAIERARFRDRLRTRVEAAPETLEARVPPLILQPLVENAVRHGVSADADAGEVAVEARLEGATLVLEVTDDGPGFGAGSPAAGSGTGLANVRERLREMYGAEGRLVVERPGRRGARVRLELPAAGEAAHPSGGRDHRARVALPHRDASPAGAGSPRA